VADPTAFLIRGDQQRNTVLTIERFFLKYADRFGEFYGIIGGFAAIPPENFDAAQIFIPNPLKDKLGWFISQPAQHKGLRQSLFIAHIRDNGGGEFLWVAGVRKRKREKPAGSPKYFYKNEEEGGLVSKPKLANRSPIFAPPTGALRCARPPIQGASPRYFYKRKKEMKKKLVKQIRIFPLFGINGTKRALTSIQREASQYRQFTPFFLLVFYYSGIRRNSKL
jgi:hypothetical protein